MTSLFDGGQISKSLNTHKVVESGQISKRTERFCCNYCDEETGWESETEVYIHKLRQHSSTVVKHASKNFICRVCLRGCASKKDLHKHLKTTHLLSDEFARKIEREIYVCNECYQIFFNKELLSIHIAKRHKMAAKGTIYECPQCPRQMTLSKVWDHLNLYHEAQSLWRCPICVIKCHSAEHLLQHMKTHPKQLHCDRCHKTFPNSTSLSEHIQKHMSDAQHLSDSMIEVNYESLHDYFVPSQNKRCSWSRCISVYNGLTVWGMKICILCREICTNSTMVEHMKSHIYSADKMKELLICNCGSLFDTKILFKQHLLKVKCDKIPETKLKIENPPEEMTLG